MSDDSEAAWRRLEEVQRLCKVLAGAEDDAVRMFALRVDAMARALKDSVLVPPDLERERSA